MKKFTRIITLLFAICFSLSVFTGYAFAANTKYIDADTALELYTELFEKYYPGENIVGTDTSQYVPVEAEEFYKQLAQLEENIKASLLPENNIEVVYDENNNIISLSYTEKFAKQAQKYIDIVSQQIEKRTQKSLNRESIVTPKATSTKYVWDGRDVRITAIPWNPVCYVGYIAKFKVSYNPALSPPKWFSGQATNFSPEVSYSGLGSCTANITATAQKLLDSSRTDAVTVRLNYHAQITIEGIPMSYQSQVNMYNEYSAATLWG